MKRASIILGLGFGDEGKGLITDYLCLQNPNALVVRFSGGHQVGHTVVNEQGKAHVFSNFGSGTNRGIPTFWSRYCTFNPSAIQQEYMALTKTGVIPKLSLSPLAMVTSPFDIAWNRASEKINQHGSVGVGFGATIERNEGPNKLLAGELKLSFVLEQRLAAIDHYYKQKARRNGRKELINYYLEELEKADFDRFMEDVRGMLNWVDIKGEWQVFPDYDDFIFEGSQGILLDQDHGFFPHVTRAFTTSRNAMEIIEGNQLGVPELYYITRAYQTRHGNGPMTNEALKLSLHPTPAETNTLNDWQGTFRKTVLDMDLISYALEVDLNYSHNANRHLVVTCLDQINGEIQVTKGGELQVIQAPEEWLTKGLLGGFHLTDLLESYGPSASTIRRNSIEFIQNEGGTCPALLSGNPLAN